MEFLDLSEKFKFIDDLSILEIINLLSIGLANYDFQSHVPSDLGTGHFYLDPKYLKSQEYLKKISEWTDNKQMKLNTKKTNYMLFNFTRKYQFNTRLSLENQNLDQVHETKLLGLVIRDDLRWRSNTSAPTRKAYSNDN